MRIMLLLLGIGLAVLGAPAALSDDLAPSPARREADKAAVIRALLRDAPPVHLLSFVSRDGNDLIRPKEWVQFCDRFLADFREQRDIEYVEPVATSQRYDDPVFRPWQDQCPLLPFNSRESGPIRTDYRGPRGDWINALPNHMPNGNPLQDLQFGTRNFKLFEGDYNNDPFDGGIEEIIFFSDGFYSYWDLLAVDDRFPLAYPPLDRNWNDVMPPRDVPTSLLTEWTAEYRLLDLQSCRARSIEYGPSEDASHSENGSAIGTNRHIGGLILYRGQYYFFVMALVSPAEQPNSKKLRVEFTALTPGFRPDPEAETQIEGPSRCLFIPKD